MTGVSKAYLVAYNAVQFLGWSYLLVQTLTHLAGGGAVADLYSQVATTLQVLPISPLLYCMYTTWGGAGERMGLNSSLCSRSRWSRSGTIN